MVGFLSDRGWQLARYSCTLAARDCPPAECTTIYS